MTEIKPCPWCGRKPRISPPKEFFSEFNAIRIGCGEVDCDASPSIWSKQNDDYNKAKQNAIQVWNDRKG